MRYLLAVLLTCSAGLAQDTGAAAQDALAQKYTAMATPSAGHARLNDLVGTWDATSKMWPSGPSGEAVTSKGKAVAAWEMGGRFIRQEATGDMMGQPVTGIGYTGYDNYARRYETFWIDNTSTAMFTASGVLDTAANVLTMYGKMDDVASDDHQKDVKYVIRIVSHDEYRFEIHDLSLPEGRTKVFETDYRRVK